MTTQKSKRKISGAPVTKWFITAASVTAMLGGWVAFSTQPSTTETNLASQTLATELGLDPIPTVVPPPTDPQNVSLDNNNNNNSTTSLSTLRSVSAPQPRPVTITRSSR